MNLTIDSLRQSGGFAGGPVKREISWASGGETYTADVFVRRLSYASAISDIEAISGDGDLAAARIANCIVDESGAPVFAVSDITGVNSDGTPVMDEIDGEVKERGGLVGSLVTALLVAIGEVNGLGKQ